MIKHNTIIIFLFLFILSSGCSNKHLNVNKIENIEVFYAKGIVTPVTMVVCGQIRAMPPDFIVDTLLSDKAFLTTVENLTNKLEKEENGDDLSDCDIRVECVVNYKGNKTKTICIGKFNCMKLNSTYHRECDSLAYLIKKRSGYYNYFKKEYLVNFREIQKFGVPDDYKDLSIKYNPNSMPTPPPPLR
ncbi:MAG: hypothetical protein NTZ69_10100 [Bacteroidia bacterium]|nr:hypothetical protein [Bacteroidia bacterium]